MDLDGLRYMTSPRWTRLALAVASSLAVLSADLGLAVLCLMVYVMTRSEA